MNGLTLRVIRSGSTKSKNMISFTPIDISNSTSCSNFDTYKRFSNATTTDEQLKILKNILEGDMNNIDTDLFKFLAAVFLQAKSKHPVKCFIMRHITKTTSLQAKFSDALADQIKRYAQKNLLTDYMDAVPKIVTCIENFPAGLTAVKAVEIELAGYLVTCLECCINTLSVQTDLAPTEKNEIFDLAHLALRLMLHLVQKGTEDSQGKLSTMFTAIRLCIKELIYNEDTPMDTKSVCGILYVTMHVMEHGADSWIDILHPNSSEVFSILSDEAAQLVIYSGIITVVAPERLYSNSEEQPLHIIKLTQMIIDIGERSSSESTFTLSVTRTILQISKTLERSTDDAGTELVGILLPFVWTHLDHYMDSVRHLTAQVLAAVVRYCVALDRKGEGSALSRLVGGVAGLCPRRRAYYVCAAALCQARAKHALPDVRARALAALSHQHLQAAASTALEALLHAERGRSSAERLYREWVVAGVGAAREGRDAHLLRALQGLLLKVVAVNEHVKDYIITHIEELCSGQSTEDLKCVLMLVSVVRQCSTAHHPVSDGGDHRWKGLVDYGVLERAAVHPDDETRILSLSLVADCPRTSEPLAARELALALHFLRYNVNAQAPHFRQLTLAHLKKFMKRLEDSYKALKRHEDPESSAKVDYYVKFIEQLRRFCFASLLRGANYSRRRVALQTLVWCEEMQLEGYHSYWCEEYVDRLLTHLEDSYENNKALALDILQHCPAELVDKKYSVSLELEDIVREASSVRPTECVSAAHKLELLWRKLPHRVLQGDTCSGAEGVALRLVQRLLQRLQLQVQRAARSVSLAAADGPVYGLLHCIRHLMLRVNPQEISEDKQWSGVVGQLIETCFAANAAVACVVNNASPEGHLPMDLGSPACAGVEHAPVPVSAQMVLLCAWRTVKEVSLLLGALSSRLAVGRGDGPLSEQQLLRIGDHFTRLLAETKHRGAFEQAYVGFTQLLTRLWRSRQASLHQLPRRWLRGLMQAVRGGPRASGRASGLCATRRSAGLPFMIQALVTTELQVQGNPKCFHECMTTLLQLASRPSLEKFRNSKKLSHNISKYISHEPEDDTTSWDPSDAIENDIIDSKNPVESTNNRIQINDNKVESQNPNEDTVEESNSEIIEMRAHCLNILRALFRNSALDESVSGYVEDGFMVAISGFEGDTWAERNSSTLLFSALMTRVFGVARHRGPTLHLRNRMTGRIFFLRYPRLYDFLLEQLCSVGAAAPQVPCLQLAARLYPSPLEGAGCALRARRLAAPIRARANAPAAALRALAAAALLPLVSPAEYLSNIEQMLISIQDQNVKRNQCHGILLQLTCLMSSKPDDINLEDYEGRLVAGLERTRWILEQAVGCMPCYIIADEYLKMINLMIWRFPNLITKGTIQHTESCLEELLFNKVAPPIDFGRDVCLANAMYLYIITSVKYGNIEKVPYLVYRGLLHKSYEVVLSTLNYLLILHETTDLEKCDFQEHLSLFSSGIVLIQLRETEKYVNILCKVLNHNYMECAQKALKVLTLEDNIEKCIVKAKTGKEEISDDDVVKKFFDFIDSEHANLTPIYLESLSMFFSKKLRDSTIGLDTALDVIRVMFAYSSSDNAEETRIVVVKFLERNFEYLMNTDSDGLSEENKFEWKATLWATLVTLLEDDEEPLRQRVADVVTRGEVPSRAAEAVRRAAGGEGAADGRTALLVVLALLDFRAEVCMVDEVNDECRVFDQNERHNIFLEETVWTNECGDIITQVCGSEVCALECVRAVLGNGVYRRTIDKLCNNNVVTFEKIITGDEITNGDTVNPKIQLFIDKLISRSI